MMQLLSPQNWKDYQLIDSGNFEKLERFGPYILQRPEPKALWNKSLSQTEWNRQKHVQFVAGAGFSRAGKEDSGTWQKCKPMQDQWTLGYGNGDCRFRLRLGLTAFKHVGVFPEQAPNWDYIYDKVKALRQSQARPPKVLNLFAYTGAASLAAAVAGAQVVHLDAVRQVVTWARGNMELSGLDGIRWILEDAFKFVKREARRGTLYDGILLDPPAYGHGPEGERWKLDECLFSLLTECNKILAPSQSFMVLNLYSNGYSAVLADSLARAACSPAENVSFGELLLEDSFHKRLPLSVFARLER